MKRIALVTGSALGVAGLSWMIYKVFKKSNEKLEHDLQHALELFLRDDGDMVATYEQIINKYPTQFEFRILLQVANWHKDQQLTKFAKTSAQKALVQLSYDSHVNDLVQVSQTFENDYWLQFYILNLMEWKSVFYKTIDNVAGQLLACAPNKLFESVAWYYKGMCSKNTTEKQLFYKKSIECCNTNMKSHEGLIRLKLTSSYCEVEDEIDKCLALVPRCLTMNLMKGQCYVESIEIDKAMALFSSFSSWRTHYAQILLYSMLKNYSVALDKADDAYSKQLVSAITAQKVKSLILLKQDKFKDVLALWNENNYDDESVALVYFVCAVQENAQYLMKLEQLQVNFANFLTPTKSEFKKWQEILALAIHAYLRQVPSLVSPCDDFSELSHKLSKESILLYLTTNAAIAYDIYVKYITTGVPWKTIIDNAMKALESNQDPRSVYLQQMHTKLTT